MMTTQVLGQCPLIIFFNKLINTCPNNMCVCVCVCVIIVFSKHTRKTDLKPMPFFPIYPALDPFFVEFPTSQSALMF